MTATWQQQVSLKPFNTFGIDVKARYSELRGASIAFNAAFHLPQFAAFNPAFYEDVNKHQFNFYNNIRATNDQKSFDISLKLDQELSDTLKLVAGVGYGDVEFAGYFGHSAADIRKLLDANGLAAPSVHVPLEVLRSALPQVIKDAKVYFWPKLEERVEVLDTWPMMRPYPYPYYWGYGPGIRVRTVTKPHSTTQGPVHVDNNKQNKVQP